MKSILISLILGLGLIMQGVQTKNFNSIQDSFKESFGIEVVVNNISSYYGINSKEYNSIQKEMENMLKYSHQVPAFGVSLDNETKTALQTGVWLKFNFDYVGYNNGMPFESLLINVSPEFSGFNVIRFYNGKYEGRCFYINLNQNMNNLYNLLIYLY